MYVSKREARKEEKKMKIADTRKEPFMKRFEDIRIGECFIDDDGDVTIKVLNGDVHETSAVCLKNGDLWFPCDSHEFVTVSASVVIE